MNITRFEPGRTYTGRNLGGIDGVISITIASRTDKSVTLVSGQTFYPGVHNGSEFIKPLGNHSMSPTVYAEKQSVFAESQNLFGTSPQVFL